MAIILNDFVEIKAELYNLDQSIEMQKGTKFCLDFDGLNNDIDQTEFATYLVPLDTGFQCPRTLVYNDGNKVDICSKLDYMTMISLILKSHILRLINQNIMSMELLFLDTIHILAYLMILPNISSMLHQIMRSHLF